MSDQPASIVSDSVSVPAPDEIEDRSLDGIWEFVNTLWDRAIFGVEVGNIIIALSILIGFLLFRHVFTVVVMRRVEAFTARTENKFDEKLVVTLRDPISFIPVVLGVFFALDYLNLYGTLERIGDNISRSLFIVLIFWFFYRMIEPLLGLLGRLERVFTTAMVSWLTNAAKTLVVFIGAATILELWGIAVGPILAGLGLFGVAVALGAQDLFKNLIAGALILIERRFSIGDWIRVNGVVEGTVEAIGFRSTSIRRFDLGPVYVPNAQLADGAVTNFSRMTFRRIYMVIGVEYRTTVDQLKTIRDDIERYVMESGEFVTDSRGGVFVRFDSFNASSIDIMLYCYANTTKWAVWLEIKERLAFKIMEIVEAAGSGFAFPSQSLYIESIPNTARPEFENAPGEKPDVIAPVLKNSERNEPKTKP